MTKPDVIDMLREYERLRRWRRVKACWRWLKAHTIERRSLKDLNADARAHLREELDKLEEDIAQPEPEEAADE